MSVRRAAALAAVLCVISVTALALPWFSADLPDRHLTVSGPQASPLAWVIAPVCVLALGLVLRAARRGRLATRAAWRSLGIAASCAALCCALALIITLAPDIALRAQSVSGAPLVEVRRLPTGFVVAGALAGLTALLLSWMIGIANAVEDRSDAAR